ncbi:MAG TPA: HhH-GPD-type base excision DNA repair protein [Candidatus Limnocylindria bacterium]|nr:HhH-GPD-type base excision DNA repair protein [Candidatus Limnocylindria bacterium]
MTTAATKAPERLHYTGDDESDRLLAGDPLALLIGFALDQQVPVQKAFSGPAELRRRLGHLDAGRLAAADPGQLDEAFRRRPALHRFPGAMARRVQALAAHVVERYDGDAARVWTDAADGADLERRLKALPSFGDMKVRSMLAILHHRFGVRLPGLEERLPQHPTLGDVDSPEALARYQEQKRAHKARLRAEQGAGG